MDSTPPQLSLRGPAVILLEGNSTYVDPGIVGYDTRNGDVTANVEVESIRGTGNFGAPGAPVRTALQPGDGCVGNAFTYAPPYLGGDVLDNRAPNGTRFNITYRVADGAGNVARIFRTVLVIDSTPPTLSQPTRAASLQLSSSFDRSTVTYANGQRCPEARSVYVPSDLHELGCINAMDFLDGDVSCTARLDRVQRLPPNLDVDEEWNTDGRRVRYGLPYSVNASCIARASFRRQGAVQTECGASAGGMEILDPTAPTGTRFVISYSASDAVGNRANSYVLLIVEDTEAPQIILPDDGLVPFGSNFDAQSRLAGVHAVDTRDGNMTMAIIPGSEIVNTVVPGQYTVTYTVSDLDGNIAVESRNVTVQENANTEELEPCGDGSCSCGCSGGKAKVIITFQLGISAAAFNTRIVHNSFKYAITAAAASKYPSVALDDVIRVDTSPVAEGTGFLLTVVIATATCDAAGFRNHVQTPEVLSSFQSILRLEQDDLFSVGGITVVNVSVDRRSPNALVL